MVSTFCFVSLSCRCWELARNMMFLYQTTIKPIRWTTHFLHYVPQTKRNDCDFQSNGYQPNKENIDFRSNCHHAKKDNDDICLNGHLAKKESNDFFHIAITWIRKKNKVSHAEKHFLWSYFNLTNSGNHAF